jgi:HEAT repeat protein
MVSRASPLNAAAAVLLALAGAGAVFLLCRPKAGPPDAAECGAGPAAARDCAAADAQSQPPGLLLAATTPEEVRAVVRLAREAKLEDVPALRRAALESPDPLVAGNAIAALGRLGKVAGDAELLALFDDPRPRLAQELVAALGRSGDASAVPRLAAVLRERDETLRSLALQALGRLGGAEARALAAAALADPRSGEVERAFAQEASRRMARSGPAGR